MIIQSILGTGTFEDREDSGGRIKCYNSNNNDNTLHRYRRSIIDTKIVARPSRSLYHIYQSVNSAIFSPPFGTRFYLSAPEINGRPHTSSEIRLPRTRHVSRSEARLAVYAIKNNPNKL